MCLPERVAILKCYSIKTCVQSGWQICIVTEESYACVCCQEGATNAFSSFIKKNACIGESGYPVLVAMVQIRLYCSQGGDVLCYVTRLRMCLPDGVGNLNCYDANANVLFTGCRKLVLVVHTTMRAFVKRRRAWQYLKCYIKKINVARMRWQISIFSYKRCACVCQNGWYF